MNSVSLAESLFGNGYSCSQALLCAYSSQCGIDQETAYKIAEGFSGGFGARGEICGAVSAMAMIIGLINSQGIANKGASKHATCKIVDECTQAFITMHGSYVCSTLKSENTEARTCKTIVYDCAMIIEEELNLK